MAIIGGVIGFWLIYALIALFAKHKKSLIISTILGCIAGIGAAMGKQEYTTLIGTIIGAVCVGFIVPIQIKSDAKEEMKNKKDNND